MFFKTYITRIKDFCNTNGVFVHFRGEPHTFRGCYQTFILLTFWTIEDRNLPPDNLSTLDGGIGGFSTQESLYPWALPAYIVFLACLPIRLKSGKFWTAFEEGWCVFTAEWDYNLLPDNLWSCSFHPSHLCTLYSINTTRITKVTLIADTVSMNSESSSDSTLIKLNSCNHMMELPHVPRTSSFNQA